MTRWPDDWRRFVDDVGLRIGRRLPPTNGIHDADERQHFADAIHD